MRGQVLGVDTRTGEGMVAGDDGRRYTFSREDWAHRGAPATGLHVDFDTQENRALSVFPVPGAVVAPAGPQAAPVNDRNKYIASALAFFLGLFGIHRFYLGRTGSGIVMLVLTITVVGLLFTWPWSWIDTIRYLVMSDEEFAARYARRYR